MFLLLSNCKLADRVGEELRKRPRVVVDCHGDNIQATPMVGDHWRFRHDFLKITLYNLCKWAGLPVQMEVVNLFSRHIPQVELARIERHRQKQGLIPDFLIKSTAGGEINSVLHKLKVISISQSRYKPSWDERAVDRRAGSLHEEYVGKARRADQLFGGMTGDRVGPVEAKLLRQVSQSIG